MFQELVVAIA